MATLTVGAAQQYATIAEAVRATQDGDTVLVQAGTYTNDFFTVAHKITMQSVGGMAFLVATTEPPNGKGIIVADNDLTIDGFGFTGAAVSDGNGAGIRYDLGTLVVRNSLFWDNQNGILANAWATGAITIENSEFSHNGAGDGYTHNLYVGEVASLVVTNSYFHDAVVGHEIKSRAHSTTITGNRIQDNALGNGSYSIDLPNGGVGLIQNNVIEKGPNTENWITIHFGGEGPPYAGSNLTVTGNTIVNDNANGYLVVNAAGTSPVLLSDNRLWGFAPDHIALGTVTQAGNTTLAARPELDLQTLAPAVLPPPPVPQVVVVPSSIHLQDWSSDGLVVRSGAVLTVGAHGQFATLAAALTVARDGDTIQVAAGTYTNDFGTVTKKVVIEGVGGMAHFVQSDLLAANNGILVVAADATLRNLEFSGAHNWGGRQGGVEIRAGHVTIVNSWFHDNDIGILADDNADTALLIVDSEMGPNGNPDRGTHNVTIGAIGSLVIRNSTIHGATTGHELSVRAYNALIEHNRIFDGAGIAASFLINLGQGGNTVVRDNVLQKGPDAANGLLIHVGGEGRAYSNSNVQITNNVLITELRNNDHPYTFFIVGDDSSGVHPPTTATGNTFIGGVAGSQTLIRIDDGGGNIRSSPQAVDTTRTWSADRAPALFAPVATGPNTLTLHLSESRGDVDAEFTVAVDGVTIGSGRVAADHAAGALQAFTFTGWWGAGEHEVTIDATNVVYRAGPAANVLYVDRVSLDNDAIAPNQGIFYWSRHWSTSLEGTALGSPVAQPPAPVTVTNPLIDTAWYNAAHPDVAATGLDAASHYRAIGWTLRYNPNPWFDTTWYMLKNPGFAATATDPLAHFETVGWREGQDPSPWFSVAAYTAAHPETSGTNPLAAFLASGEAPATPRANPYSPAEAALFDTAYYNAQNPNVAANGFDALTHYATLGWREGKDPSALFNTTWYLTQNPDVASAGIDPLQHFAAEGWKQGRDPSPQFSVSAYLAAYPDVAASGIDPLQHYMQTGRAEGRTISPVTPALNAEAPRDPLVDSAWYYAQHPQVAAAGIDAAAHYNSVGWTLRYDPNPWFDTTWYQLTNPEISASRISPLLAFETTGWQQGHDPSPWFSLSRYQAAHPETAGVDPLVSFLASGEAGPTPGLNAYSSPEAALFDAVYYNAVNPDVPANHFDALTHYETFGWLEGRDPSATFSTTKYLAAYSDVRTAGIDPLAHYASVGIHEGRVSFSV